MSCFHKVDDLSKEAQVGRFGSMVDDPQSFNNKLAPSEAPLQTAAEKLLISLKLRYFRIPQCVWDWCKWKMPPKLLKILAWYLGGAPDLIIVEKISDKYNLCLQIELKSKTGKLQQNQKNWKKDTAVNILREEEGVKKEIAEFLQTVELLKDFLKSL